MRSTVVSCLRYRDTPAMLDWLCTNLGFTTRLRIPGEHGEVMHAELTLGDGMVMVGTHSNDPYGQLLATPAQTGGLLTQTIWIHDAPQGGRAFACRDPEGHLWQVGTYDPWGAA